MRQRLHKRLFPEHNRLREVHLHVRRTSCVQTIMRIIQSASVGSLAAAGPAKASANIRANAAMRIMMDNEWLRVRSPGRSLPLAARRLQPSQPVITVRPPVGTLADLTSPPP